MKTFELYGDVYPEDSKYARLMAQFMMPPTYGRDAKVEWELYRDFALKKRMSDKDMEAFMVAKDSGHHNMILRGSPKKESDMEELYSRQFRRASSRVAEDECSSITDTMDYVRCRATKMEKEQGTPAEKAFPTAWSIACKYKRDQLSDADKHCQKNPPEYFKSKKATNGDSMNRKANRGLIQLMVDSILPALYRWRSPMLSSSLKNDLRDLATDAQMEEVVVLNNYEELLSLMDNPEAMHWLQIDPQTYKKAVMAMWINGRKMKLASEMEAEWDVMARFEKGKPADPTENMSEEDKKKWEEMKEKHGDKFKQAHDKTARLMSRQIKILEDYVASDTTYYVPPYFFELPSNIKEQLRRVKDQETLEDDVTRWLLDWKTEQRRNSRWANTTLTTRSAKENPMNKTARVALRTLTANWGLTANEAYEMLAEEELAEYLAEMEAEMWAEEMEAGGNKLKPQYKSRKDNPSTWWIPNKYNEDRGGNGRGGQKNKNYLYYDYGKADSYNKDYWKRWKEKSEAGDDLKSHRENCPDMRGGSMPCKRTKEQQERFEKSRKKK